MTALELLNRWKRVPALVEQIARDAGDTVAHLRSLLSQRPPPRRHFVLMLVLVEGRGIGGRALELFDNVDAGVPRAVDVQVQQHLDAGTVLVFCDLAAVDVTNIFAGHDLLAMNLGSGAPIAKFDHAEPGMMIRAYVRIRERGQ